MAEKKFVVVTKGRDEIVLIYERLAESICILESTSKCCSFAFFCSVDLCCKLRWVDLMQLIVRQISSHVEPFCRLVSCDRVL